VGRCWFSAAWQYSQDSPLWDSLFVAVGLRGLAALIKID
jgi:hypothetical protein